VLTGMEGKLWIDEKTFQWVKVEATVIRPVSIEGFLAEVEPGYTLRTRKGTCDGQYLASEAFCDEIARQGPIPFHTEIASGRGLLRLSQTCAN
jgi:hypothetical protein